MILKGSQRGGARNLASHLLKQENEHIDLVELRGFIANDLTGAFDEARAIAQGTQCRQFLFSLSLSPPEDQIVPAEGFQEATNAIEKRLGLEGQPRAIVIHEKEGRRHAHAVWSRIDAETMTARPLPFFKNRLQEAARELYLEHGWQMPDGLRDPALRNPDSFTRAEWQQARRNDRDPREIKQLFRQCWEQADGGKAFEAALRDSGFVVARGDRRGYVAVDHDGEIYSLSRWSGQKTKALKERIGNPDNLPSVDEAKHEIIAAMTPRLNRYRQELKQEHQEERSVWRAKADEMAQRQRRERERQKRAHEARERKARQARAQHIRKGLSGLWDRVTGKAARLQKQHEFAAWQALKRDRAERDELIWDQMQERQYLQRDVKTLRKRHRREREQLGREIGRALRFDREPRQERLRNEREALERQHELKRGRSGPDRGR